MNFRKRFSKNTEISNFVKISPVEAELFHADGRMDMTKITVNFRNFANVPKTSPTASHCEWVSIRELRSRQCPAMHKNHKRNINDIPLSTARRTEHGGSNGNASDIFRRWPFRFSSATTTILRFNTVLFSPSSQILIQHVESGHDCSLLHPFQCGLKSFQSLGVMWSLTVGPKRNKVNL
jgi:hypothetical protein